MPVPGKGDGDLCRAKASTGAFHREGSNAGLVDWADGAHPQLYAAADVPNASSSCSHLCHERALPPRKGNLPE